MTAFSYRITSVTDKDGKVKQKLEGKYFIKFLELGRGAILFSENGGGFKTSKVESISIWDNEIAITTLNSVYYLEFA